MEAQIDDTAFARGVQHIHNHDVICDELLKMLWETNKINMRKLNELGEWLLSFNSHESLEFSRGIAPFLIEKENNMIFNIFIENKDSKLDQAPLAVTDYELAVAQFKLLTPELKTDATLVMTKDGTEVFRYDLSPKTAEHERWIKKYDPISDEEIFPDWITTSEAVALCSISNQQLNYWKTKFFTRGYDYVKRGGTNFYDKKVLEQVKSKSKFLY